MVTRVDRKPVIYGAGFVRLLRPALQANNRKLLEDIIHKSAGHAIPKVEAYKLKTAFEDVDVEEYWDKMDINFGFWDDTFMDEEDIEILRVARAAHIRNMSTRSHARANLLSNAVCDAYKVLIEDKSAIYYGPEAVYLFMNKVINGKVFQSNVKTQNWDWATNAAYEAVKLQGPYLYTHTTASHAMALTSKAAFEGTVKFAWDLYKKTETLALRLTSRKSVLAHAYHAGGLRKAFEPCENILDDFELPLTGYTASEEGIKVHVINGLRCISMFDTLFVLTHDDSVTLSLVAQCYFRNTLYFSEANGYSVQIQHQAIGVVKDIYAHISRKITCNQNFAETIRSIHICAQKEFNDIYEEERGDDLGWQDRSENYTSEAIALDSYGPTLYKKITDLAISKIDRLNVGMMYHMFVGDDMLISDLKTKVATMSDKVRAADAGEWASFLKFCKSYLLSRFIYSTRSKPKTGGESGMMNQDWVRRCMNGHFSMPHREDWGKVWIEGEYPWSNHADTWHLDAQDVSYVAKDLDTMKKGDYRKANCNASELLMAMEHGDLLDPLTKSTPTSVRNRIKANEATHIAVLTTAPKSENAKPSWKKRVTFAADNEFRKMQAEYDRNARRAMFFIRGPSLGIDQTVLETQFHDIAVSSATTTAGAICSHDISAWSESMDRDRKFEFEQILINMTTEKSMTNIKRDWEQIHAVINKQGLQESHPITQGSFQGFDGSASTILHSMILLYCLDTARHTNVIPSTVKTNLATLIDDCVALMNGLTDVEEAQKFWTHLKATYDKLGFEVDDLKSIFSTIKAIYLSRRFLLGGEVPADYKIFIKAHVSYEDPLRSITDVPKDIFGALRGACDANGQAWFTYYTAFATSLMEISHQCPGIKDLPHAATAIAALAPHDEMGWGFPSMLDWATNDVVDKRNHFNSLMESASEFDLAPVSFKGLINAMEPTARRMFNAIKSQPWRNVTVSSLFSNPFEAVREGPMKPDMLKRNAVGDILQEIVRAEPWKSLLAWNTSETTNLIRELLASSGPLHAPTISAMINCMPDNYRLGMIGKAVGSNSVLDMLPRGMKVLLKRRVQRVGDAFIKHMLSIFRAETTVISAEDIAVLSHSNRTIMEREAFYELNGVVMTDHTFPDPVGSFTRVHSSVGSKINAGAATLRLWDVDQGDAVKASEYLSAKGIYIPKKSARVWEVTTEYGKGWDSVSQKIALGLAILARARADGHSIDGLFNYFIYAWNEGATIKIEDANMIAIQGSVKRLDSNPGNSTHPITVHRNICSSFYVDLTTAVNAIKVVSVEKTGIDSNLHDIHSHFTAMRTVCAYIFECQFMLNNLHNIPDYEIGLRRECVIPTDVRLMETDIVANRIRMEILDSATEYGLVQSCPDLAHIIVPPTMQVTWISMINCLFSADYASANMILESIKTTPLEDTLDELAKMHAELSSSILVASEPAKRASVHLDRKAIIAYRMDQAPKNEQGDGYTMAVGRMSCKAGKLVSSERAHEVKCAIVIKSALWHKLKSKKIEALAAIIYGDPDSDYSQVKTINTIDTWKNILCECTRHKIRGNLGEVIQKAFFILGVHGCHITASVDPSAVCQSIMSYFGANLLALCKICADDILSIAGRSSKNFEKPAIEMMITHQPNVWDGKLRREHMLALIRHNVSSLKNRLKAIDQGEIQHVGDRRACSDDNAETAREKIKAHRTFLQVRRMVYKSVSLTANGDVEFNSMALCSRISKAAFATIKRRVGREKDGSREQLKLLDNLRKFVDDPTVDDNLDKYLKFPGDTAVLDDVVQHMTRLYDIVTCVKGYWNLVEGDAGVRYSIQQISEDNQALMKKKFAISASEVAPKVYRHLRESSVRTRDIDDNTISEVSSYKVDEDDDDMFDPLADDYEEKLQAYLSAPKGDPWKKLVTLLYTGKIAPDKVDEKLGTDLGMFPTLEMIRNSGIEMIDPKVIVKEFDTIDAMYELCGLAFSEDWYLDDSPGGYTVDEAYKGIRGSLV